MISVALVAPDDLPLPPLQGGSVQIYLTELVKSLKEQDDIHIMLISPGVARPSSGSRWRRVKTSTYEHYSTRLRGREYRDAVRQLLRKLSPDIVQIDNRPSWYRLYKQACPRAKFVINLHSTTFLGPQHISQHTAKSVLTKADVVVCNSRHLQSAISKRFGLKAQDWHPEVIYPGVAIHQFKRPSDRTQVASDNPLRLLYVGRVIRGKGVHILIRSVRILSNRQIPVHLTVVGRTPPWEAKYKEHVRQLSRGLPIRFDGFISPSRLPKWYWRADAFVCPSQMHEAFGLVNVEAMAAGLPVVASKQGGIREVVTPSCGILVERYRDPKAFADAIQSLYANKSEFRRFQQSAIHRASQFTWAETTKKFAAVYRKLAH